MRLIGTNAEVGTFPEDIVRGVRSLGLDAEAKEGLTLDDVRTVDEPQGHPVIALAQLWRSQKDTPASAADEWDCGHYIVVLAVDDDFVYFQDPYIRMGKGFMPRKTFEDHWHQIMGGRDLARSGELRHLAIFIRGEEPSRKPGGDEAQAMPDLGRLGLRQRPQRKLPRASAALRLPRRSEIVACRQRGNPSTRCLRRDQEGCRRSCVGHAGRATCETNRMRSRSMP